MAKILCITLNPAIDITLELEKLHIGEVNRQQQAQSHAAGKGLNVAQVLKDLGHEVYVSGFLGQDNRQIFEQHFAREQFHDYFVYVEGETRQNIKIAEQSGRMTDINGKGFSVSSTHKQQLLQQLTTLASQVDCIVVAGSLPQQFDLSDFSQLIEQLKQSQSKIALDTSGQALKVAMQHQPWLIKPNTDELRETFAVMVDSIQQQAMLLNPYQIEHAVISMGEQGVNWLANGKMYHADTAKVHVKSTVGAGDTLLAGMVHGLLLQQDDAQILRMATALATHAVTQVGFHIPQSEQLEQLMHDTSVYEIQSGIVQ